MSSPWSRLLRIHYFSISLKSTSTSFRLLLRLSSSQLNIESIQIKASTPVNPRRQKIIDHISLHSLRQYGLGQQFQNRKEDWERLLILWPYLPYLGRTPSAQAEGEGPHHLPQMFPRFQYAWRVQTPPCPGLSCNLSKMLLFTSANTVQMHSAEQDLLCERNRVRSYRRRLW